MEVDFSKLTRDYRVNPLKRGEMIQQEDLQYLFIEANLTLKQMAKIINRHPNQIGRQCKENHVIKGKEQSKLSLKKELLMQKKLRIKLLTIFTKKKLKLKVIKK